MLDWNLLKENPAAVNGNKNDWRGPDGSRVPHDLWRAPNEPDNKNGSNEIRAALGKKGDIPGLADLPWTATKKCALYKCCLSECD